MTEYVFEIRDIPGVPDNPLNIFNIKALEIITFYDDEEVRRCTPAFDFLDSLTTTERRKFFVSLNKVAQLGKRCPTTHFKPDAKSRGIFEIKTPTGNNRLLCFPDKEDTLIICFNCCTKSKGRKVQTREFDKCFEMKKEFYAKEYSITLNEQGEQK